MKKMSIAEQTLKKQIERIKIIEDQLYREKDNISARIAAHEQMRQDLEAEQYRLQRQREAVSDHKERTK